MVDIKILWGILIGVLFVIPLGLISHKIGYNEGEQSVLDKCWYTDEEFNECWMSDRFASCLVIDYDADRINKITNNSDSYSVVLANSDLSKMILCRKRYKNEIE